MRTTPLTPEELARVAQLCGCIEHTFLPCAYYLSEQIRDLRAIAAELRRIHEIKEEPNG